MHIDIMRKESLKQLLKGRRDELTPESVGLRRKPNGRSRGLTIEDTAALARLSVRGYAQLENGEYQVPSADLLDAVAEALVMDEATRTDLYFLATGRPPNAPRRPPGSAQDWHWELVHRSEPRPSLVTDHAANVLAFNDTATSYFASAEGEPLAGGNTTLWLFEDKAAALIDQLERARALAVGRLKVTAIRYPDDPAVAAVVERLCTDPTAARLWDTQRARSADIVTNVHIRERHGVREELLWTLLELRDGSLLHTGLPPQRFVPAPTANRAVTGR